MSGPPRCPTPTHLRLREHPCSPSTEVTTAQPQTTCSSKHDPAHGPLTSSDHPDGWDCLQEPQLAICRRARIRDDCEENRPATEQAPHRHLLN